MYSFLTSLSNHFHGIVVSTAFSAPSREDHLHLRAAVGFLKRPTNFMIISAGARTGAINIAVEKGLRWFCLIYLILKGILFVYERSSKKTIVSVTYTGWVPIECPMNTTCRFFHGMSPESKMSKSDSPQMCKSAILIVSLG